MVRRRDRARHHPTLPAPGRLPHRLQRPAPRQGRADDAVEIGQGCNRFPPAPDLASHLSAGIARLALDGSLSAYTGPRSSGARTVLAELLSAHLGVPLEPPDIFVTRGGTEAISLTIDHLAETGHDLQLPLPNYYAFDQSAAPCSAPVTGCYRHDGHTVTTGTPGTGRTCLVEVLPNGVTSTRHTLPPAPPSPWSTSPSRLAPECGPEPCCANPSGSSTCAPAR
ncbi:hypothetical protein [Streptomyces sp. NPDC020965]|uniref:hypothetical protein n=1 Tax=Streptomyces sp. NPDC020965 TaxID=3365105 RepID=UPI0037B641BC